MAAATPPPEEAPSASSTAIISPLPTFKPDLFQRAWTSVPHPILPLLATTHAKSVTVFSLATFSKHSALTGGHSRSVRTATWQPGMTPPRLVTGSFDATAGLWSWSGGNATSEKLEREVTLSSTEGGDGDEKEEEEDDWTFNLVLEGHESEVKGVAFSPTGQYLATCSRDKTVWIWEDVGIADGEGEDEWETVAVLSEHDGDVKAVAWCPDVPGRNSRSGGGRSYSSDVLASASYDNTVRIWREDSDGEWVCVAVLEGHDGTVWGLEWETKPREGDKFPRLLTYSADATIRIWTLRDEADDEEEGGPKGGGDGANYAGFGGIPNTMRRSLREDWDCTAVLPQAHTRDIYSVAWSTATGLVASTGSDGIIALYGENAPTAAATSEEAPLEASAKAAAKGWQLLATVSNGHGPYEINHVTWCKRYDLGTERKGEEEMLVTTGDDGIVRPWQVRIP
ncbi:cytosolic iron-sulfur protein assembly protein [Podospora didyma]|uniref:Probable cytosolic iron-sulfur protein assembly protein 1 n=1 Tax=Podospora didyma TaxID=330526 RepID=A0AAE0U0Z4_9PEZI|nr:cytosolic iron-sulfur protein assembly protein [Podospora didyma]